MQTHLSTPGHSLPMAHVALFLDSMWRKQACHVRDLCIFGAHVPVPRITWTKQASHPTQETPVCFGAGAAAAGHHVDGDGCERGLDREGIWAWAQASQATQARARQELRSSHCGHVGKGGARGNGFGTWGKVGHVGKNGVRGKGCRMWGTVGHVGKGGVTRESGVRYQRVENGAGAGKRGATWGRRGMLPVCGRVRHVGRLGEGSGSCQGFMRHALLAGGHCWGTWAKAGLVKDCGSCTAGMRKKAGNAGKGGACRGIHGAHTAAISVPFFGTSGFYMHVCLICLYLGMPLRLWPIGIGYVWGNTSQQGP